MCVCKSLRWSSVVRSSCVFPRADHRAFSLTQFQELLEKTNNRVTEDREEQEAAAAETAEGDDAPSRASVRPITSLCGRVAESSCECVVHVAGRTGVGKRCRRAGLRRRVIDQRRC